MKEGSRSGERIDSWCQLHRSRNLGQTYQLRAGGALEQRARLQQQHRVYGLELTWSILRLRLDGMFPCSTAGDRCGCGART